MDFNSKFPASAPPEAGPEIAAAMDLVRASIPNAQTDPMRPKYHFVPPAKEMIDVWGGIYYKGTYRLFYDLNVTPFSRMGGAFMQLRTSDFIHWDQLPLAALPSPDNDELRLNDGCVIIRPDGTPILYCTSVYNDESRPRVHFAMAGDADMIVFKRLDPQYTITLDNHGGPEYRGGWSDVFFFQDSGRTFMIISKCLTPDGKAEIPIYEAADDSCLKWKYLGTFFDDNGEVVNFTKVGDKWLLVFCPYGNPVYYVGTFDPAQGRFSAEKQGILSYGYVCQGDNHNLMSRGFYATSMFTRPEGGVVVIAWMSGFLNPDGWDGCISLPRDISLDNNLDVVMTPVRELEQLRRKKREITGGGKYPCGQCFDLELDFTGNLQIRIGNSLKISSANGMVFLNDTAMPARNISDLRLLVDVSTAELFCNGGRYNITRCIPMIPQVAELKLEGTDISGRIFDMMPI